MSDSHATLTLPHQKDTIDLPVKQAALGYPVVDISTLKGAGYFTLDPGFLSTASCQSAITYIDGEQGDLLYRGYPIGELAEHSDFPEVCYLLLKGELPSVSEKETFVGLLNQHTMVHEQMCQFFNGFRRDAHPMAVMVGVVGALSAFYHDALDIHDEASRNISAIRLIAKIPTIAAMCYKYSIGQPFMQPQNHLGYAENFLHMLFATPTESYTVNPVFARAMDQIFILHADHEQNASTSTVRVAGSTGANPFACIASGIAALWGPAHGGANEACLNMLKAIGSPDRIPEFLARAKDPNDPFKLMGFGHRVYKNYDPRAKAMQKTCHAVLEATGRADDPLFQLAMSLEKIAREDDYFVKRKLYPNVDFYSGIILSALGIPTNMFTVIFALSRTIGWVSHWNEMISQPGHRISRPRQLYVGPTERAFVPLDKR